MVCELHLKKVIIKKKRRRTGRNVLQLNGWELSVFLIRKSLNQVGRMMLSSD